MALLRAATFMLVFGAIAMEETAAFAGGGVPPPTMPTPPPPPPPLPPPSSPPATGLVITSFTATNTYSNIWTFSGTVTGGDGSAITINFADAPSMIGQSTPVNADGTFSFTTELTQDDYGEVTAQAVDADGEMSETDFVYVFFL